MSRSVAGPINAVFDQAGISFGGTRVLVKPNLLGPYPPERAITTHPAVVQAVVQRLLDEGARVVVGDNSGEIGVGTAERVAASTGILEASLGCFADISRQTVQVALPKSGVSRVTYSEIALEVDHIVSLPKLKTHLQTQITGAVKNSFGLLVGREKTRMHTLRPRPDQFVELVVDVFQVRPPSLIILDAVTGMEGNGPSGGIPGRHSRCRPSSHRASGLVL